MLADRLEKNIYHRHLVFGIPDMLWKYFQDNRKLYKVLMDIAYKTIKETLSKINHQNVIPGIIEIYHPFGRDIKHQPHVHMIVTEDRITSRKGLAKYFGRYVRHPAIANCRITNYNKEAVRFYWRDHDDKIHYKIMKANDFISAII